MRAATGGERANSIRIRNLSRFALCHDQIFAWHRSPLHIRRTGASPAIDAMTIDQRNRPALQNVSRPTASTSTSDLHRICLAQSNHKLTLLHEVMVWQARTPKILASSEHE